MNGEDIKNKTVITNYSNLLEVKKKYHTAEDSLLYYTYKSNSAVSINANDTEKECAKIYAGYRRISSNRTKYPNYLKSGTRLEAKDILRTEKSVDYKKGKSKQKNETLKKDATMDSHNRNKTDMDNYQESICNANDILTSNTIKNSNYFEACSKFIENNHPCSVSANPNKEKLLSQNESEEYLCEDTCLQNRNRYMELQTVIDENEKLRIKLKVVVESLREILIICDQTDEEATFSNIGEGCENKHTRLHDDCFKFPQMHQLNEKIDLFGTHFKQCHRTTHQSSDSKIITRNGVLDTSYRSDSEWVKILKSKQCLVELQKQNRIILRNLKELKESLRERFKGTEFPNNKIRHYSTVRKKTTNNSSKSFKTSVILKEKIVTANKPTIPLKEQSEILREMVKFSKLMKGKGSWIKDNESMKSTENASSIEVGPFHCNLNKVSKSSKKALIPQLLCNAHSKFDNKVSTVQKENIYKKNDIDKFCKRTSKGNSRKEPDEVQISPNSLTHAKKASSFKTNHKGRHSYPKYNPHFRPSLSKSVKSSGDITMVLPSAFEVSVSSKRRAVWK